MSSFREASARGDSLVVVGDRATTESLTAVLAREGLEVVAAAEPNEALEVVDAHHPAAVIIDNQADNSGLDLTRRLKEGDPASTVIVLTGAGSLDAAMEAISDFDGLLLKPLLPQAFVHSVRRTLSVRTMAEQNQQLTDELARQATHGPSEHLTPQPPDRSAFADQLSGALAQSQLDRSPMAVVVLEIGGWETVAEQLGADSSEETIASLAARLAQGRRKSDIVRRVAVDRFALACADIESTSDCHRVVRVVLDALEGPVTVEEKEHWLAPRAGAVITDPGLPGQTAEMVLSDAEMALQCAKDEGRPWRLFEKSMLDQVFARRGLGLDLREAMDNEELSLVYNPIVDVESSHVLGVALRLSRQQGEPVFLSSEYLAQEGDLALSAQLSAWMLDRAFADLANWREQGQLSAGFTMAISVSGRDAGDPQFAETLEEVMRKHEIPPAMIEIDLSAAAARQAASESFSLSSLGDLGVRFNLDDFGTSEIELSWLGSLPLHSLKIDGSLVEALDRAEGSRSASLVRALIALGREMRISVIAKGVRTTAQRAALVAMGCETAQYARFGRPGAIGQPWEPDDEPRPAKVGTSPEQTPPPVAAEPVAVDRAAPEPVAVDPAAPEPVAVEVAQDWGPPTEAPLAPPTVGPETWTPASGQPQESAGDPGPGA